MKTEGAAYPRLCARWASYSLGNVLMATDNFVAYLMYRCSAR